MGADNLSSGCTDLHSVRFSKVLGNSIAKVRAGDSPVHINGVLKAISQTK